MDKPVISTSEKRPQSGRARNDEKRTRKHLTQKELNSLLIAAKKSLRPVQSYTLILLMFRHGLRSGEAIALKWQDIDFEGARIFIRRLKHGIEQSHPLDKDELKTLRALKNKQKNKSIYVFVNYQGLPYTENSLWPLIKRLGVKANIDFPIYPHMLRHTCGTLLAAKTGDPLLVKDYLGQRKIDSAMEYINLSGKRFETMGKWWD